MAAGTIATASRYRRIKRVKLAELRDHLPADTPAVTPDERAEELRLRRARLPAPPPLVIPPPRYLKRSRCGNSPGRFDQQGMESSMGNLDGLGYRGTTAWSPAARPAWARRSRILGDLGATVHVVDIQPPKVPNAAYYPTDLAELDQVAAAAEELAGSDRFPVPLRRHAAAHRALRCMRVNYIGTRQFVEEMLPALKDGGGIALISSDAGDGTRTSSRTSKCWRSPIRRGREWCEADPEKRARRLYHVQGNAGRLGPVRGGETGQAAHSAQRHIAPCPTRTAFMDEREKVGREGFMDPWPYPSLGRMATAEEQAWPLVLLNSPLNAAVTGAFLYTDQGYQGGIATGAVEDITKVFARRRAEAAANAS